MEMAGGCKNEDVFAMPMIDVYGIKRKEGNSVGTISPYKTMREVVTMRVEYRVVIGATLIWCP